MHQHSMTTGYMYLGTAIKGDWSRPVPIRSLQEFKDKFGPYGPEGSITYDYVGGLLSAGLPVLFQRIACKGQANVVWSHYIPEVSSNTPRAKCANYTISHNVTSETRVDDCIVEEKFGGTYGNNMNFNIKFKSDEATLVITVRHGNTVIEKTEIVTIDRDDTTHNQKLAVINAINSIELETINISAPVEIDPETGTYKEEAIDEFEIPLTGTETDTETGNEYDAYPELAGGTDFDEALVPAEIPELIYPKLTDKLLYYPKFITSGGYTDNLPSSKTIGEAMKNLTTARQDCRALIDLPLGTKMEDQQTYANVYTYSQFASNGLIPSASICAPWVYMQIGSTTMWTPPSFVFLSLVGGSLSNGSTAYTPKAGLTSGRISGIIKPEFEIGSDIAEEWQKEGTANINPIMRLQSGNYVLGGNSTLLKIEEDEVNAFNESSADLAIIEIRRFVYNLATELQYQYNNADAFENFSISTSKFLDTMASNGAVNNYTIANVSTEDAPRTLKIKLDVWVTPTIKRIEIYLNVAYGNISFVTGGEG